LYNLAALENRSVWNSLVHSCKFSPISRAILLCPTIPLKDARKMPRGRPRNCIAETERRWRVEKIIAQYNRPGYKECEER